MKIENYKKRTKTKYVHFRVDEKLYKKLKKAKLNVSQIVRDSLNEALKELL